MVQVYFATNRVADAAAPGGYGTAQVATPGESEYGAIAVTGTDLAKAASGTLGAFGLRQGGGFDPATRAEIVNSGKNLLVFIHGFANSFPDAMKRAAFNRQWFAASGRPEADTVVLAFSWPSLGAVVDLHDGSPDPTRQYKEDRIIAGRSSGAIAAFLREALSIAADMKQRAPATRAFLLAHSMGNHALNGAVPALHAGSPLPARFDEAILAAPDEDERALELPDGTGMVRLRDAANRISVYANREDVILDLSLVLNAIRPMGKRGPASRTDTALYPPTRFRTVDCSDVHDLLQVDPAPGVDMSHQYYRRSRCVRDDIALLMANGAVKPGLSKLRASFWRWW